MAVLATPFFLQFVDDAGVPVKNGKVYTYAAGTTTPKVTFTDFTETVVAPNPVPLDAAGRATIWINGAYKYVLADENDVVIRTTDNVVSFSTPASAAEPFSQTFSGDGTNKNFTLSESMGTDPLNIIVYVDNNDGKGYNVQIPNQYSLSNTSLVFGDAPAAGTNNIYVFAPSTLLSGAAASAQAAATSEANAAASAEAAQDSEDLAEEWATKTDGLVEATDNSSKAYAIGGVGVTDTPDKGAAKEWANKTTGTVDGSEYSSKAYAIGGTGKETDNAKYYKEQAEALYGDLSAVEQAAIDAQDAAASADLAAQDAAASADLAAQVAADLSAALSPDILEKTAVPPLFDIIPMPGVTPRAGLTYAGTLADAFNADGEFIGWDFTALTQAPQAAIAAPAEISIYFEGYVVGFNTSTTGMLVAVSDGTASNVLRITRSNATTLGGYITIGGVNSNAGSTTPDFTEKLKCMLCMRSDAVHFTVNGALIGTVSPASMPAFTKFMAGTYATGTGNVNANLRLLRATAFAKFFTQAQAASFTTGD